MKKSLFIEEKTYVSKSLKGLTDWITLKKVGIGE